MLEKHIFDNDDTAKISVLGMNIFYNKLRTCISTESFLKVVRFSAVLVGVSQASHSSLHVHFLFPPEHFKTSFLKLTQCLDITHCHGP